MGEATKLPDPTVVVYHPAFGTPMCTEIPNKNTGWLPDSNNLYHSNACGKFYNFIILPRPHSHRFERGPIVLWWYIWPC